MNVKIKEKLRGIMTTDKDGNKVMLDVRNVKECDNMTFIYFKVDGEREILDKGMFKQTYPEIGNLIDRGL